MAKNKAEPAKAKPIKPPPPPEDEKEVEVPVAPPPVPMVRKKVSDADRAEALKADGWECVSVEAAKCPKTGAKLYQKPCTYVMERPKNYTPPGAPEEEPEEEVKE